MAYIDLGVCQEYGTGNWCNCHNQKPCQLGGAVHLAVEDVEDHGKSEQYLKDREERDRVLKKLV